MNGTEYLGRKCKGLPQREVLTNPCFSIGYALQPSREEVDGFDEDLFSRAERYTAYEKDASWLSLAEELEMFGDFAGLKL